MSTSRQSLSWLRASGSHHDIGRALGEQGKEAVHRYLIPAEQWKRITHPSHTAATHRMMRQTKAAYPWIHAEIEGLSEGLEIAFEDVFAWNCRGDLLADISDGCTTVLLPGATPTIAHNEDGLPDFAGHCFIAEVSPHEHPGFLAFCYPGSICGHTFAVTDKGLVVTADNLRLRQVKPEIPRMVLSRAVLAADTVGAALAILRQAPASGGFHLAIAQAGNPSITSVEYGGGQVGERQIMEPSVHVNHALLISELGVNQIITASSRDRQARGNDMLSTACLDPMRILRDTDGSGWPIWRRNADDPDCENTLASAVFCIQPDEVRWWFYDGASDVSVYASEEISR